MPCHRNLTTQAIFTQTGGATEEGGAAADLGDQSFKIVGRVKRQCNLDYVRGVLVLLGVGDGAGAVTSIS